MKNKRILLVSCLEYSSKSEKDLQIMLGLNKTVDKLAMENSARWYGHE